MNIPQIGDQIWASAVKPGFIIQVQGETDILPVSEISEGYTNFVFSDGIRSLVTKYDEKVTYVGNFNL